VVEPVRACILLKCSATATCFDLCPQDRGGEVVDSSAMVVGRVGIEPTTDGL
jgi:hypothetical protein